MSAGDVGLTTAAWPVRRRPDIALADREPGWRPAISLRNGLTRTLAWYRSRV